MVCFYILLYFIILCIYEYIVLKFVLLCFLFWFVCWWEFKIYSTKIFHKLILQYDFLMYHHIELYCSAPLALYLLQKMYGNLLWFFLHIHENDHFSWIPHLVSKSSSLPHYKLGCFVIWNIGRDFPRFRSHTSAIFRGAFCFVFPMNIIFKNLEIPELYIICAFTLHEYWIFFYAKYLRVYC